MFEGGQEWVGFEHLSGKFLPCGTSDKSLACEIKEKWIVVVEFIEYYALFLCDETLSGGGVERERGREGWRWRRGGRN